MSAEKLKAEKRTEFGKGAARRLRAAGQIPAVVYGHGNDPLHLALPGHATMMALRHGGANALLDVDIDGDHQLVLAKEVQVDPIRRVIEHVDLIVVVRGEKVTVEVPVLVVGEPGPDSLVVTDSSTIQVEAEATHLPEQIEVSVEGVTAGTQILASDIELPKGVTLAGDGDVLIVNVVAQATAAAHEAELAESPAGQAEAAAAEENPAE
ncbi:50S ribosomal protein L25/general stress protein Ctc [Nocardioides jishulii]|uniref:Large ribosomal subunit protein bL25 n=1 Tax=Nocardioides jishulii TaxID=2575440 RepID=A0A4U2YH75_9ACTN|nr:50S ribosomal protein L25/general stress protein Ctc [Nocardioides jishulii]QCX26643.1 50S ribosomal protein L25/general stress protein Ctc [Nocardioides jishulii]TKI60387.1 50S ribosomal protein L25/general stress protein Ctc [Nocardioides jishulii]